jgi:hypothetical protein
MEGCAVRWRVTAREKFSSSTEGKFPSKPSGHYMYCTTSLTLQNSTFCPHSIFTCFVWIWEQTAIISLYSINWLVFIKDIVFTARYELHLRVIYINLSKPNGHYMYHQVKITKFYVLLMYHQFNIQQFYVLPTQCIYVFCVDRRTKSDYFLTQH